MKLLSIIIAWLPLVATITILSGLVYVVTQQNYRQSFNDPQIQMAEDAATSLSGGEKITPTGKIDISKSLAPFMITYDLKANVVGSNAFLNGQTPTLPPGVLTGNKDSHIPGENRVTWQPQEGVRIAAVIVSYSGGYVLVGRNMRELEIREDRLTQMVFLAWLVGLGTSLVLVVFKKLYLSKR